MAGAERGRVQRGVIKVRGLAAMGNVPELRSEAKGVVRGLAWWLEEGQVHPQERVLEGTADLTIPWEGVSLGPLGSREVQNMRGSEGTSRLRRCELLSRALSPGELG